MKYAKSVGALCLCVAPMALTPAAADDRKDIENLLNTTLNLVRLLVEQGALDKDKAEVLIREAQRRAAGSRPATPATPAPDDKSKTVRVPYVPESVKNEMREQIKQEVLSQAKKERWGEPGALPDWIDRIRWEGDIRLRMARDIYAKDNAPATVYPRDAAGNATINLPSTTENRDRLRVRARLGMQAQVSETVVAGVRLATGSSSSINPVSTTQTLGNSFNSFSLVMDRAYLRLDPRPWLTVQGGRFASPWLGTNLVWHDDLGFDGLAATFKPRLNASTTGFLTGGYFPLQEFASDAADKYLLGAQAGAAWEGQSNRAKVGLALYDFKKVEGKAGAPGSAGTPGYAASAPQFRQRGNSLIDISDPTAAATNRPLFGVASKFRLLNATGTLTHTAFDPVHITFTADYVKNIGFDRNEIATRAGLPLTSIPDKKNKGYQYQMSVGMPLISRPRDWQVYGGYRYLERDAVLDAYNDSDFHAGGTDNKGYFIGANYGVARNTSLGMRWMSANAISGPPLAIDTLFVDLNVRF